MDASDTIACPRCKNQQLHKFGRDPKNGKQKYRCKKCRHQFVPGHLRQRKYPTLLCPKCGSPMDIFKKLREVLRFRCRNYKVKGPGRCKHKTNLALDGTRNFPRVSRPEEIELLQGKIDDAFHWNRMDFAKPTVVLAVYYTIVEAMPAPQVVRTLWNVHRVKVSHDSITRWHHKAAFHLSAKTASLAEIPVKKGRKPRLYADETERKVAGEKRWFWLSYCRKYDLMIGRNLTERRSTKSARDLLSMTQELAPALAKSELLTDGLASYPAAMGDLDWDDGKHIRYLSFFESPNNNALERKWSNFHVRAKPFRGFKSDAGQMAFIEGQVFYHNCLKPSVALGGQVTPYQYLNARLPKHETPLELIAALLT